jgi:serine-type D-Ala-D-Ala carboxypeptidase (penicillin-binding protein 5/6)
MNSFWSKPLNRIAVITLPLAVAVLSIIYFWPHTADNIAVTADLSPKPQVLSENAVLIRQDPAPAPVINPPELIKPLQTESVQAKSFLVYDMGSNATLANHNEAFPLPIASLTKLMTAYVVYQHLLLATDVVTIGSSDVVDITPVLGVKVGDHLKAIDLFNAMLIGSANDAAQTLSNYVGLRLYRAFPELMNEEARRLGMEDSHFNNPVGFDSETNYATAKDLQLLVNAVQQYQAFALIARDLSYSFTSDDGNKYYVKATNKLVGTDPEISAIKTGYTDEAQGAMITQINHLGHKFIIIVLGSPDREGDTLKLKKAIINSYQWKE